MATYIWVNTGSENNSLLDSIEPLTEPESVLIFNWRYHAYSTESNFTKSAPDLNS